MGKRKVVKEKEETLYEKLLKLSESIAEEFDMMELIEDEIKDLFQCDLNCATCSHEEQGNCLQKFKKGNLYWLRKVVQDERMIKEVAEKMFEMRDNLLELADALKVSLKMAKSKKEKVEEVQKNREDIQIASYFT